MIYRCILPPWAAERYPSRRRVVEGPLTQEQLDTLNEQFYNIYFLPNFPSHFEPGVTVDGSHIDTFRWVFVDMDLKEGKYLDAEAFVETLHQGGLQPTLIVHSGNGVHAYWAVTDLDAMSFLKLQRRLLRKFNTDEAVAKIYQLMRVPGTVNTKHEDKFKLCEELETADVSYSCEDLDKWLPPLTHADDEYCKAHFDKTYKLAGETKVDEKLPPKFGKLLRDSQEVKDIWLGKTEDRSKSDFRLGHIMHASGFTRAEAMSVLVNSAKAMSRAPVHRIGYAETIVDKIWTFEMADNKDALNLSSSVREILMRAGDGLKGTRFPCWRYLDATEHGFRLGQVIGLVAGSGVGKTAVALNMFEGFVQLNPDYHHFFVPLEQPANEIADRWKSMCGDRTAMYDKVHVISNYAEDGSFRHLSLEEIQDYLVLYQEKTGHKVGCVVIDHIGALKKKGVDGENQGIMDICHEMKAFAIRTNTLLVMQSQSSREKAGIGDLEINKDAAYGTVYFESYCDYLITIWQPLKRCYNQPECPPVTAFKFCKIRHKKANDAIKEDTPYQLYFDSSTERFRLLTQTEEESFKWFNRDCARIRGKDRKTDELIYTRITWADEGATDGKANSNQDSSGAGSP